MVRSLTDSLYFCKVIMIFSLVSLYFETFPDCRLLKVASAIELFELVFWRFPSETVVPVSS